MWLQNLLGLRKRKPPIDPDEEPARVPMPAVHLRPPDPAKTASIKAKAGAEPTLATERPTANAAGFDPYNSGTFKKKGNAWEKVVRR